MQGKKPYGDRPQGGGYQGKRDFGDKPAGRRLSGQKAPAATVRKARAIKARSPGDRPRRRCWRGAILATNLWRRLSGQPPVWRSSARHGYQGKKPYGDRPQGTGYQGKKPYGDKPQGGYPGNRSFEKKPYNKHPPLTTAARRKCVRRPPRRGRKRSRRAGRTPFLILGRNAVKEAIKSERSIDRIVVGEPDGSLREILGLARERKLVIREVDRRHLDEICLPFGHGGKPGNHQGIVAYAAGGNIVPLRTFSPLRARRTKNRL